MVRFGPLDAFPGKGRFVRAPFLAIAFFFLLIPDTTQAARLALVIGNNSYETINRLKNAAGDAELIGETLVSAGFQIVGGVHRNLKRKDFWRWLDEIGARVKEDDEIVFYYAGHGLQIGGSQFLLPIDIRVELDAPDGAAQVEHEAISIYAIQDRLKNARLSLLVIDACRDNPFAAMGYKRGIGEMRGLPLPEPMKGSAIIMAAGRGQTALDKVPGTNVAHGLFTYELVQSIKTPGKDIHTALREVREVVEDIAKREKPSHQQRPALVDETRGVFYFFPDRGLAKSPQKLLEDEAWALCRSAVLPLPCRRYLESFPHGTYEPLAQTRLADLEASSAAHPTALAQPQFLPSRPGQKVPRPVDLPQTGKVNSSQKTTLRDCKVCPEMVVIDPGTLMVAKADSLKNLDISSFSEIGFPSRFAVGRYEVTFDEWDACVQDKACTNNPGDEGWGRSRHPVVNVSWPDTQEFLGWLSRKTGTSYRLLRDAEWQFVAAGGSKTRFPWGDTIQEGHANCNGCGAGDYERKKTAVVGTFRPNSFGLYDAIGNVWEWVEECYTLRMISSVSDSAAFGSSCSSRTVRGGSFDTLVGEATLTNRREVGPNTRSPGIGFRVARDLN
jgi:formylglycine-generating enzyme required for sulfatase activity